MRRTTALLAAAFAIGLVGVTTAACSNNQADQATPSPTPRATSQPAAAPTSAATPTPSPTATPVPDPIFSQVELPADIVSEPQLTLFDATPPSGVFGWLGVGHEYQPTRGRSTPVAWSIDTNGTFTASDLPLPANHQTGHTWRATVINGVQIIGGAMHDETDSKLTQHPLLWSRDAPDSEWRTDQLDIIDLPGPSEGNTSVWALEGSDTWGMLLVGFEAHEKDADGNRPRQRFLAQTTDGRSWLPIDLPGIDDTNWALDVYLAGDHGLVTARSTADDDPTIIVFATSDAGDSWQQSRVEIVDDDPPSIIDAHWDGEWIIVGSTHDAERNDVPAVFTNTAAGIWSPQPIEIDLSEARDAVLTDGSYVPFTELEFAAIHRLDESRFVGLFDTKSGSLVATSTDLVQWQLDLELQLNESGYSFRRTDPVFGIVADTERDRLLALRGFEPPVWLNANSARTARVDGFDTDRLDREALISHQDTFVWFATTDTESFRTRRWVSADGIDWQPQGSLLAFRPTYTRSVGDAVYSFGYDNDLDPLVRIFTEGDGFEFSPNTLSSVPFSSELNRVVIIAPTTSAGRHVIARSWTTSTDDPYENFISFLDLDTPELLTTYQVPSVGAAQVKVVCPQLDSGETAIMFTPVDDIGTLIEVWADRDEPRVGHGVFSGEAGRDVSPRDCDRVDDGLVLTGTSCPENLSSWNEDDCDPGLWISPDGLVWHQHPQQSRLLDANVEITRQAARANTAALVTGWVPDGGETTLWSVTSSEILPVPLDGTAGFDGFDIDELVVANGRVLLADNDGVFVGDLEYLAERARDEGALLPEPAPLSTSDQPPAPDIVLPPDQQTEPIVVNAGSKPNEIAPAPRPPASTVSPGSTAAPAAPPASTAPAQPQPTATPAPAEPPALQERVCTTTTGADGSLSYDCTYTFES